MQDIKYIGVDDLNIDLFESQFNVPEGMAYNSYLIIDDKIAIMDSVESNFSNEWLNNIQSILNDKAPDYLIVQHMEPDHSGSIKSLMDKYPNCKVVSSAMANTMLGNFYHDTYDDRKIIVKDGDSLNLGKHNLHFISAPMIHWPEVIMTYDDYAKVLFSADAFGRFGKRQAESDWLKEARRYYVGIVGKFGDQVITLLNKIKDFDIQNIASLHGPLITENIPYYINLYKTWASYQAEKDGILIAYTSVYKNTKRVVTDLCKELRNKDIDVQIYDLARCDIHEAISATFIYPKIILATTTYNGEIFPIMNYFIDNLVERNIQNKQIAIIENGSWAAQVTNTIKKKFEKSKNIKFLENIIHLKSSYNELVNEKEKDEMIKELLANEEIKVEEKTKTRKWRCKICGYILEADELRDDYTCPLCKHPASDFEEIFD